MRKSSIILLILSFILYTNNVLAKSFLVNSPQDLYSIQKEVKPGDSILFANRVWTDAQIELKFSGTEALPIRVLPQTTGQVIFSGTSMLKISGSFIIVDGFVFKDINNRNAIIQFRTDKNNLANNCRVTNSVIDNCNPADRLSESNWIILYGRNNRFDHNTIINKKNLGTTLTVELNNTLNQNNHHSIDHNYFGPRDKGGSNGAEIIRIGNSTFSRTSSQTIIEENYFDRCNGEVEIISVKSCDNILRRNTFFECEGGLVLRHGNRNTVEENYFIGNNKIHTGGVRIINAGHTIKNNFFYQLAGERFRSALTVLNGVPNSPINRYDKVKDVTIQNNTFLECRNVELCAGKDFERTAVPENVVFSNNTFINQSTDLRFVINDDISGFKFQENKLSGKISGYPPTGFIKSPIKVVAERGQWKINQQKFKLYATLENTGATWYKNLHSVKINSKGKLVKVEPGENTLYEKAATANDGDTLQLSSGVYLLSKVIIINKKIVITGTATANSRPLVQFTGEQGGFSFFSIENGGNLSLSHLRFNGLSANAVAESFIRTSNIAMLDHYNLFVNGCDFENITDGRKNALKVNKGSFADTIQFTNCLFNNISGEVISIAAEKEDKGIYNAEYIIFNNCVFNKILVGAIDVYRGGNDESTTGPYFTMNHCTFNEVGNVELCSVVRLIGVQYSTITNCIFNNSGRSGRTVKYEDYGWTKNSISFCNSYEAGKVESFYSNIIGKVMLRLNPLFENISTGDFRLKANSPLKKNGNDGKDLGAIFFKDGQLKL
ncbi:MAG: TonB-dependent receptor [Sediminibacterium sp.]|nr:TonB-dependent receptor [Sediminibacterium sp.]